MQDDDKQLAEQSLTTLTAEIASAYVANNTISTSDIARLIADVGRELQALAGGQQAPAPEKPEPAVAVRRSIGSDHLTCLVCGKKQRLLKRHLAAAHDLTPAEYRRMFDLKVDYPMVAPSYAEMRRDLAIKIGLGRPKKPAKKSRGAAKKRDVPAKPRRTKAKAA
jgi:predicted transcriptional regulator